MTFLSASGDFAAATGAIGTTQTITVGFETKLILFWGCGRTDSTDANGRSDHRRFLGYAVSTTQLGFVVNFSTDTVGASVTRRAQDDTECVAFESTSSAFDVKLKVQSITATTVVLEVTDAGATGRRVQWVAIGGTDVTCEGITFTQAVVTGAQSVTGHTIQPDAVLLFGAGDTTMASTFNNDSQFCVGFADSALNQGVFVGASNTGAITSQTMSYCRSGEVVASFNATITAIDNRANLTGMLSNGYTLNWTANSGAANLWHSIAIKGGTWKVGSLTTQTDTTTAMTGTVGTTPSIGLFCSAGKAADSAGTATDDDVWSFGGFTSTSARGAVGISDDDGSADMVVATSIEFDAVYTHLLAADGTIAGTMDINSLTSTGFTTIMDDADPSSAFVFWLAGGGEAEVVAVIPTIGSRGALPEFQITLKDAFGNTLEQIKDWQSVEFVRAENDAGVCNLVLPGHYPDTFFQFDYRIEIARTVGTRPPYLDTETIWLMGIPDIHILKRAGTWNIQAFCLNTLLNRMVVDYAAGSAYAEKNDEVDDLMKAVIRENRGSLATDTTRDISAYLTVAPDETLGPVIAKAFSRRNVLTVFQELAQASYEAGTYLAFDVMMNGEIPQFRTYIGQRGIDHRNPGGYPPLLVGPDFGNLDDVHMTWDYSQMITRAIAGAQGLGEARIIARADNASLQGLSPYGLIEHFTNTNDTTSAGTQDAADSLLRSGLPRMTMTGRIEQTDGFVRGLNWEWGDLITAQAFGFAFDAHITRLHVRRERDAPELADVVIVGAFD